jgi:uncharacterized membrane protein YqjE
MPVPEGTGSAENPSLFVSLRSFWSVLIAIFYTRLDLATSELEDAGIRIVKVLVLGLSALLCFLTAFFWAMFLLLACFWNTEYRLLVLGIIFALYLIGGILCFYFAREMFLTRQPFLSQTLAELRRDVEGLRKSAHHDEAKP